MEFNGRIPNIIKLRKRGLTKMRISQLGEQIKPILWKSFIITSIF